MSAQTTAGKAKPVLGSLSDEQRRILCAEATSKILRTSYFFESDGQIKKGVFRSLPDPDNDARDALELVEFMRGKGLTCRLYNDFDDGQWECVFFFGQRGEPGAWERDAVEPTVTRAITSAALLALNLAQP